MILEDRLDPLVVLLDDRVEGLDHLSMQLAETAAALDDGRVGGQGFSRSRPAQNHFNDLRAPHVMSIQKLLNRAGLGLLEGLQGGPLAPAVASVRGPGSAV